MAMTFLEACPLAKELMLCLPSNFLSKPWDPSIIVVVTPLEAIMNDQVYSSTCDYYEDIVNCAQIAYDSTSTPFLLFRYKPG